MNKISLVSIFSLLFLPSAVLAGGVSGKAVFTGTAPQAEKISMAADPACASLHSELVYDDSVVVNGNGTLKNVFVYVKEKHTQNGKMFLFF